MLKITLPDSGKEVEYRPMGWDEAEGHLDMEEEVNAKAGTEFLKARRAMIKSVIELCAPGGFEAARDSNRDVMRLYGAITAATWDREAEGKKLLEAWDACGDPGRIEYCRACGGRERGECADCESRAPELLPENRAAWALWGAAGTQWRAASCGIIGLDYTAVFEVARVMGLEMTPALLGKIRKLELRELARMDEERKERERNRGR